jgi:deoxycytidylate deaminase
MVPPDIISKSGNPELFIGLTSAAGTDLSVVVKSLEEQLNEFKYRFQCTHLIEVLHQIEKWKALPESPIDDRIRTHMDAGNQFRIDIGHDGAIALLGISDIRQSRMTIGGIANANSPISRIAYVLRGLKHPEEVQVLRRTYGQGFLLVGIYCPHQMRLDYLARRISESRHDFQVDVYRPTAEALIQRDQEESGNKSGQNLRDTFHRSDVFVDASDPQSLRVSIERFIDLVFGNPFHTPTRDEYGMFHAQAAALRSADLGRQVGAAIATKEGDIIAVGTNEVPKAGGGLYWTNDKPDQRDFVLGYDSNDRHKRNLLADLLERLKNENWLSDEKRKLSTDELLDRALSKDPASAVQRAQMMNLIEFGRAVHAEMAALTYAARRGVSVDGSTLYCTTFPCHLCAREIVAAGIRRVVYIEPYPKSRAAQLYPDSISVESVVESNDQVSFEPFVGVAPRQYMNLFSMLDRKSKNGSVISIDRKTATCRCQGSVPTYVMNEELSLDWLNRRLREKRLIKAREGQ